jgi:hypothetical protein
MDCRSYLKGNSAVIFAKFIMPIQTIAKQMKALNAIKIYLDCPSVSSEAKLGLIYVIVNETIKEVEPEIAAIKAAA